VAFERQRAIVSRLRAAMRGLREAVEECRAALSQWNSLGTVSFTLYAADASWAGDQGDVDLADLTAGVTTLGAIDTLWVTSGVVPPGPHATNIAKGAKP
jgi:hypothetical protein